MLVCVFVLRLFQLALYYVYMFACVYVCALPGAFRLGLRRIIQLRRECAEVKTYLKEMQLAERNIDATETSLSSLSQLQVIKERYIHSLFQIMPLELIRKVRI